MTFDTEERLKTISITINADLKVEDREDFAVLVIPINSPEQPFPVQVNPGEDVATVTIDDEDGKDGLYCTTSKPQ